MERVFDSVQPQQDPNVYHGYLPKELGISQLTSCKVITLPTKVRLVKATVFPMVMYGCESWTVKKAEH